jgi:hypothetical protein
VTVPRRWILERIEDRSHAVLSDAEGGETRHVPMARLPEEAREGDALLEHPPRLEAGDPPHPRYTLDPEGTERLRREAEALRASLRRGPTGPISL